MERALRQTVVIGPGGRFEGSAPGFAPGTAAEVILIFQEASEPRKADDPREGFERYWKMSDDLIAKGMETWDLDRVRAEIAERRGGYRENP